MIIKATKMASGALFGNASGRSQSKNLVEFRAGKMTLKDKMVTPDKRKGMVYVHQSDDSLMHFCWKDRTTGTVEDDLIIFPEDIEFKHLPQCTTGRAYLLKFKNSARKYFFWIQEPKSDKDEENCRKVNDFLNHPPTPGSNRGTSTSGIPSDLSGLGDTELQNVLSGMSQQQLMQLLGGGLGMGGGGAGGLSSLLGRPSSAQSTASEPAGRTSSSRATTTGDTTPTSSRPATATAATTQASTATTDSARQQIQLSDLQNILSTINVPPTESKESLDLTQALNPESMIPILANPEIQAQLVPHLPEGESLPKTEVELRNTISSPQFQQALSSFSAALQSGELGSLMTQFGLGDDVANAAAQGDMEAFVKAMQERMKKDDKDGNEKMEH